MEYYSAIKKNTLESVLMRWMTLELIIQSDKPERKTPIQYTNKHIYMEFRKMVILHSVYVPQLSYPFIC